MYTCIAFEYIQNLEQYQANIVPERVVMWDITEEPTARL